MSQFEDQLMPYWQAYKTYFNNSNEFEAELYKWKAIKLVSDKWNVNSDFKTVFEDAFHVSGPQNLWSSNHFYPIAMYREFLQIFPDKASETMSLLFDESIMLQDRLKTFVSKVEEMRSELAKLFPDRNLSNHFHSDIRAISLYLSLQYPEKYFIYKSGHYIAFLKILNEQHKGSGGQAKYLHFLEIANQVRDFIKTDSDFMMQYSKFTDEPEYYNDTYLNLLVQDFIFFCVIYYNDFINKTSSFWIFQGNPKIYDVVSALNEKALKSWTVTAHKEKIKPGDKVILWLTGENSGCYALCKVISPVENIKDHESELKFYANKIENENHDRVQIEVEYNWWDQPILKHQLVSLTEFSDFNGGKQGTNFASTSVQYDKLLELYWKNSLINKLITIDDRHKIEQFLNLISLAVDKFGLKNDDPRISFSTPKTKSTHISATIGQRYIISLENKSSHIQADFELAMIADRKYKEVYEQSRGFKKFGDFSTVSTKIIPPQYAYFDETVLPVTEELTSAWLSTLETELKRVENSSTRKHHNPLLFKAVVDLVYRKELLDEIFKSNVFMIEHPLNQILYGPPGTGKTYNTINKAVEIANPSFALNDRVAVRKEFERLTEEGVIGFVSFHQSMSYEDFIEGIKPLAPDPESKSVLYDIEDGIFKMMSNKAESNFQSAQSTNKGKLNFDDAFERLKDDWEEDNKMFFPLKTEGHDYSIIGFTNKSIQFRKSSGGTGHTLSISTLKEYYYKRREVRLSGVGIYYPGILNKLNLYNSENKISVKLKNYVLIIDEINRGNISQIFGELITLIEEDKRLGKTESLQAVLPYSKEKFGVPQNLYIIGTMNTADRSIEALDTALRRRFTFVEMPPIPEIIREHGKSKGSIDGIDLVYLLQTINSRIEKLLDKDHQIGHSYFFDVEDMKTLKFAFKNKILPLLEEYFYGDMGKIGLVLGNSFIKEKTAQYFKFAGFNGFDADTINDLQERKVFEITPEDEWDAESFKMIYK